ncbi:hypothetical protein Nepgr_028937 [Nepenthes gracilis]|uniref:Uncharacterized protein n=1 Tax=Nepenthes gracilis TaxID=150966 RepID=A0AAD3TDU0_NEPGR|nr:hypothetical protein Nepgr_028937 [Nepenthes gracilis]
MSLAHCLLIRGIPAASPLFGWYGWDERLAPLDGCPLTRWMAYGLHLDLLVRMPGLADMGDLAPMAQMDILVPSLLSSWLLSVDFGADFSALFVVLPEMPWVFAPVCGPLASPPRLGLSVSLVFVSEYPPIRASRWGSLKPKALISSGAQPSFELGVFSLPPLPPTFNRSSVNRSPDSLALTKLVGPLVDGGCSVCDLVSPMSQCAVLDCVGKVCCHDASVSLPHDPLSRKLWNSDDLVSEFHPVPVEYPWPIISSSASEYSVDVIAPAFIDDPLAYPLVPCQIEQTQMPT